MTRAFKSEVSVGRILRPWWERQGFTFHPECQLEGCDERPDAILDGITLEFCEIKLGLTLDAIAQASRWVPYAHRSWLAVPHELFKPETRAGYLAERVLRSEGVGLILVAPTGSAWRAVAAKFNAVPTSLGIREQFRRGAVVALTEAAAGREAGSPGRGTNQARRVVEAAWCAQLHELVEKRPRISVTNAAREIGADERFKLDLKNNRVPGFRVTRERIALVEAAA